MPSASNTTCQRLEEFLPETARNSSYCASGPAQQSPHLVEAGWRLGVIHAATDAARICHKCPVSLPTRCVAVQNALSHRPCCISSRLFGNINSFSVCNNCGLSDAKLLHILRRMASHTHTSHVVDHNIASHATAARRIRTDACCQLGDVVVGCHPR